MRQVALIATVDRIHGVEDRDVHNGHRPRRPAGPDLFSENAIFTRENRGVVEAGCDKCDLIPASDWIETCIGFSMVVPDVGIDEASKDVVKADGLGGSQPS